MFTTNTRSHLLSVVNRSLSSSSTLSRVTTAIANCNTSTLKSQRSFATAESKMNDNRVVTRESLNPKLLKAEYAVRGEIVLQAEQYRHRLTQPNHGLPFNQIISCNIGNPHELGQQPITFHRQVLALCTYPQLLDDPDVAAKFPKDVQDRARAYLRRISGGTGAYSNSQGLAVVREEVAKFIQERDDHKSNPDDIFLTDGASAGVRLLLASMIRDHNDGILIPIPQYPLYSASLALCGGYAASYYLDERTGWSLSTAELARALKDARAKGVNVRGLVIINPGNPTGQCLTYDNMQQIVEFCARERLVIMADEVYQANIYHSTPFTSFKKVCADMNRNDVELVSYHSVSKGFLGECGRRGAYFELYNIAPDVKAELYKASSINLCSNIDGQIMTGLMVQPPTLGDESYALYEQEKNHILQSLQRRAVKLAEALNRLEGVTCNPVEGALYAFPRISLPQKAIQAAKNMNKSADTMYCLELLSQTGICVVPGSGFGQEPNTYHFRTTILPLEDKMDSVIQKMSQFHHDFMQKYA